MEHLDGNVVTSLLVPLSGIADDTE